MIYILLHSIQHADSNKRERESCTCAHAHNCNIYVSQQLHDVQALILRHSFPQILYKVHCKWLF